MLVDSVRPIFKYTMMLQRKSKMDREKKLMLVDSVRPIFKYTMMLSKKVKDGQREEADVGCLCNTHLKVHNDVVKESQRWTERRS